MSCFRVPSVRRKFGSEDRRTCFELELCAQIRKLHVIIMYESSVNHQALEDPKRLVRPNQDQIPLKVYP
jgi:hypothetical protein